MKTTTKKPYHQDFSEETMLNILKEMKSRKIPPSYLEVVKKDFKKALKRAEEKSNFLEPIGCYNLPKCTHERLLTECPHDEKSYRSYVNFGLEKQKQKQGSVMIVKAYRMKKGKDGNLHKVFSSFGKLFEDIAIPQNRVVDILSSENSECERLRVETDLKNHWIHILVKKEDVMNEDERFFVFTDGLYLPVTKLFDHHILRGIQNHVFIVRF